MSGFGGGVASLGMKSGGGFESVDIQLTAQSTGRTFGSYSLTNTFSQAITTNWGYNGYFAFEVPNDDTYRIMTRGANGTYQNINSPSPENYGAEIVADIAVTKGWIILFIAGQTGGVTNDNEGSGGGGMSAVAYTTNKTNGTASVLAANPLVVGGGGGGACLNRTGQDNARGYGNVNSNYSDMLKGLAGLASGYSALGHGWNVGGGGLASNGTYNIAGWNGGGFNTGGSGNSARSGGSHGNAFKAGAVGGANQGGNNGGGFSGGGGGAENCGYGGGAGGYSGGGSGGYSGGCGGHGGGGGSFYENSGSNSLVSRQNYNTRYGYVRIRSSDQYP